MNNTIPAEGFSNHSSSHKGDEYKKIIKTILDGFYAGTVTIYENIKKVKLLGHCIAKHWRGDFSLSVSYWINLVLLTVILNQVIDGVLNSTFFQNDQVSGLLVVFSLTIVEILFYIWQIVGCWRSANKHVAHTGREFWARIAQVVLVLGAISNGAQFVNTAQLAVVPIQIAMGNGPYTEYTVSAVEDGGVIEIEGFMGYGMDKALEEVLDNTKNVQSVSLNSLGGLVDPARKVRALIKERGLDTYVANRCASACLIAFMGGHSRLLYADAKLGFHSYSSPGETLGQIDLSEEEDKQYYRLMGIDSEFLEKAFRVPANQVWYPEIEELVNSKFITHTYNGEYTVFHGTPATVLLARPAIAQSNTPQCMPLFVALEHGQGAAPCAYKGS